MHITIYECHARSGCAPEVISLFDEWRQHLCGAEGHISTEVLRSRDDAGGFIAVARFADADAAWATMEQPAYREWYERLISLSEFGPVATQYQTLEGDPLPTP